MILDVWVSNPRPHKAYISFKLEDSTGWMPISLVREVLGTFQKTIS